MDLIQTSGSEQKGKRRGKSAMTLTEVVLSIAIFAVMFGAVLKGLIVGNWRTTWVTYDAAATKAAEQQFELIQNGRWDLTTYPITDDLVSSNFPTAVLILDNNGGSGNCVYSTNTVTITTMPNTTNPSYKVIQIQEVWSIFGRGPFTNSVFGIRAPDQ